MKGRPTIADYKYHPQTGVGEERVRELRKLHLEGELGDFCTQLLKQEISRAQKAKMLHKLSAGFPEMDYDIHNDKKKTWNQGVRD